MKLYFSKHKKHIITTLVVLIIGIAYYIFTQITGIYIPCPIYKTTGLFCPGCGISHFFSDLFRLKLGDAVQQNLAVAILIPVWLFVFVLKLLFRKKTVERKILTVLEWASLVFLILFGICRNIPAFSVLVPLYMRI